jgi:hypothetical protein
MGRQQLPIPPDKVRFRAKSPHSRAGLQPRYEKLTNLSPSLFSKKAFSNLNIGGFKASTKPVPPKESGSKCLTGQSDQLIHQAKKETYGVILHYFFIGKRTNFVTKFKLITI